MWRLCAGCDPLDHRSGQGDEGPSYINGGAPQSGSGRLLDWGLRNTQGSGYSGVEVVMRPDYVDGWKTGNRPSQLGLPVFFTDENSQPRTHYRSDLANCRWQSRQCAKRSVEVQTAVEESAPLVNTGEDDPGLAK
jgi:hypothetical protein